MKYAITTLENSLQTLENNEPINRAEGNTSQADLEARGISEIRLALEILRMGAENKGGSFGWAIAFLRLGGRVRRVGWNGKGMWLEYFPANGWARLFGNTTDITNAPFIGMKTADEKMVPWLASQTDMLAMDWESAE